MAKFTLSCEFTAASGKLNATSDDYFRTNTQTGTVSRCHRAVTTIKPTEEMVAHREAFGARTKAVSAWYRDPANADALAEYRKRYKAQHKIGSLFAYLVKYLDLDVTPTTPTVPDDSSSGSDTPDPNKPLE